MSYNRLLSGVRPAAAKEVTMMFGLTTALLLMCVGAEPKTAQKKLPTALSQKAAHLKRGMTKAEVLQLLGPPTWAILPSDKGEWALPAPSATFELRWINGNCNNVAVTFDAKALVSGWDEGRAVCFEKAYTFNPPAEMSCKRKERIKACR